MMRVVVADDDLSQRVFLAALLKKSGYDAIVCSDGAEALAALDAGDVSMLICDIEMPVVDGLALARAIRQRPYGRYIYILLVTGARREDFIPGLEAGADDFMTKPVDPAILNVRMAAARRLLDYDRELRAKSAALTLANARIEDDLAAAGEVQRSLLPNEDIVLQGCRIRSFFLPSRHVSGDMFNYFELGDDAFGFYLADVAGHGVRAALLAASLAHLVDADYFRGRVRTGEAGDRRYAPSRLLGALNDRFADRIMGAEFFTMVCGVFEQAAGRLTISTAGHPPPLVAHSSGEGTWLGENALPVGMFTGSTYRDVTAPSRPGDRLVVYSDGIAEVLNAAGEPYGEERLARFATAHRGTPADELFSLLVSDLNTWADRDSFWDDVSMILIER